MPTCSFCKRNYEIPSGLTIFTIDGRSIHYCSSKCRKNVNIGRDPKRVKWVKKYKGKISRVENKIKDEKFE